MPTLKVVLGKDGSVKSEVIGVKGPGCKKYSDFLNNVFGGPDAEELKASYYETSEETDNDLDIDGLPGGHCG